MTQPIRPTQVTIFAILSFVAALFTLYLGTIASAYYLMAISLLLAAYCLWTGWYQKVFKNVLLLNQVTGIALIVLIAYRKIALPSEEFTLTLSGIALVGNVLVGGPFLAILAIPLIPLLSNGKTLPAWFNAQSKQTPNLTNK
ncbi:MAG TPA: hypothetical protein ENI05_05645 [Porticoccus sp.]|nr:hypothetical protein [Porticoccus sp.]